MVYDACIVCFLPMLSTTQHAAAQHLLPSHEESQLMLSGQVMIGLLGPELSAEERELLQHPQVAGVILFSRNYQSPQQLRALTDAIHSVRQPSLLIGVDHEGGRVQRFRDGFTPLPAARRLGDCYDHDPAQALLLARSCGVLLASEIRAVGVDFSFAPVLDLDYGCCPAIGDRALHHDPNTVAELAFAVCQGLRDSGCATVGKHFPGHGAVTTDSHLEVPLDQRHYADLAAADLIPFANLIQRGLSAVLPAHVIYIQEDTNPAGFSPFWLQTVLRERLGFTGAIISDDLDMAGAGWAGAPPQRASLALTAVCDLVLACNDRAAACAILDSLSAPANPLSLQRLEQLRASGPAAASLSDLHQQTHWQQAHEQLQAHGLL